QLINITSSWLKSTLLSQTSVEYAFKLGDPTSFIKSLGFDVIATTSYLASSSNWFTSSFPKNPFAPLTNTVFNFLIMIINQPQFLLDQNHLLINFHFLLILFQIYFGHFELYLLILQWYCLLQKL